MVRFLDSSEDSGVECDLDARPVHAKRRVCCAGGNFSIYGG